MTIEDGLITATSTEQTALERRITSLYNDLIDLDMDDAQHKFILKRENHISYLHGGLQQLPAGFVVLDSSRPWLCYWIVHSLALLDAPLPVSVPPEAIIDFLARCQDSEGGFGGGPHQLPHLAPTYAAVASLVTLGGDAALDAVDRDATFQFLQLRAVPPQDGGGFTVCAGGEVDVRGAYTALATAHMLKLDKAALASKAGVVQYVCSCQTYEGGLGGEPGNEAHGGYTYCGLAALMLVNQAHQLDLPRLVHWAVHMQGQVEGGFMGRTNKLVDGCYSFWQGGIFPLLRMLMPDYLAQTCIPLMAPSGSAAPDQSHHSSSEQAAASSGSASASSGRTSASSGRASASSGRTSASSGPAATSGGQTAASSGEAAVRGGQVSGSGRAALASDAGTMAAESHGGVQGLDQLMGGVLALQGKDPVVRALDDLHRTKVKADSAAEAAAAAEQAHKAGAGAQNASQLYQKAHQLHAASDALHQAVQRAMENTDTLEATAAVLCTSEDQLGSWQEAYDEDDVKTAEPPLLYNVQALQLWLLKCCQAAQGGMRDKPGKPPDYYHTCYCLSGLSSCQSYGHYVLGPASNKLVQADPLCNVVQQKLEAALSREPLSPVYL